MLSENVILSSNNPRTKLVVICNESDRDQATAAIGKSAPIGWSQAQEIRLLEVGSRTKFRAKDIGTEREIAQDPERLRKTLDRIAPPEEAARTIIVGDVRLYPALSSSDPRAPIRLRSTAELRALLPNVLRAGNLDWQSHLMRLLEHYHLEVDAERVAAWRQQFNVFGGDWIAEALLKLLDFWPSSKLSEALFRVPGAASASTDGEIDAWLASYDHIAFNNSESGDSSAMVLRLTKTRVGEMLLAKRTDFKSHIDQNNGPSNILLLEDCVATGTEIVRLLATLPPDRIKNHKIDMKFAVGTQSGCKRLEFYLKQQGLSNVRVHVSKTGILPNLTTAGLAASDDALFRPDGDLLNPSAHIIEGIELRAKAYLNKSERNAITRLCESICRPLLRLHLQRTRWTPEKIEAVMDRWKLGFSGLGLLLAFAHGVPKPTLPLFWVEGPISVEHESYRWRGDWIPLFPRPLQEHLETVAASANGGDLNSENGGK